MSDHPHAILSVSAMGRADSYAVSQGVSGSVLMQNAGEAAPCGGAVWSWQ